MQACRKRGAGGACAPPLFERSVNPISTRGGTLSPPSTMCPTRFSDLATALDSKDHWFFHEPAAAAAADFGLLHPWRTSLSVEKMSHEFELWHKTLMKPVYNFRYKIFLSLRKLTIFMDVPVFEMRKLSTYRDWQTTNAVHGSLIQTLFQQPLQEANWKTSIVFPLSCLFPKWTYCIAIAVI